MMRVHIGVLAVLLVSSFGAHASPAELPPDGYIGRAFVDSDGCAFTRATLNDTTIWVARLDASRAPVCDEVPTFQGASSRALVTSPVAVTMAQKTAPVLVKPAAKSARAASNVFKPAWTDGRHNPNRGPRTAKGTADMNRIWSDGVPMVRRAN